MADYLLFTLAYLAAAMTPGADTTLVLSRALESQRKAWFAGAGIALAKVVLLVFTYIGASTLLNDNPALLLGIKMLGAGFLGYRAVVLWRRSKLTEPPRSASSWADFGLGFGTAFTNPQPLAFYLAIVPQVAFDTQLWILGLIVVIGFGMVTLVYSSLAKPISALLAKRGPMVVNRTVAVLLVLVAGWILLR
jgi:threonine/homoserine/homoserine lactone efflux protein